MREVDASGPSREPILLELEGIAFRYPARGSSLPQEVLAGLDLTLERGDFTVVAGRSGSGKTTLLQIASGLLDASVGEVRWMGRPIADLAEAERARLRAKLFGYVFQAGGLLDALTAAENIAVARGGSGPVERADRVARIEDVLARVGLHGRADRFPSELSGGEQQRLGLARALYADPAALLIDEPTANLDRATADAIIQELVALHADGRALLVASHDARLLARAQRVLHLD